MPLLCVTLPHVRLVTRADFEQVANIVGGIHAYAEECDPSIGTY